MVQLTAFSKTSRNIDPTEIVAVRKFSDDLTEIFLAVSPPGQTDGKYLQVSKSLEDIKNISEHEAKENGKTINFIKLTGDDDRPILLNTKYVKSSQLMSKPELEAVYLTSPVFWGGAEQKALLFKRPPITELARQVDLASNNSSLDLNK